MLKYFSGDSMIIINKSNLTVQTMEKAPNSPTAAKDTFYPDIKLCLALEGTAQWEIEDRTYCITPGDIIFLNIGQKRQFTAFGETGFKLCAFVMTRDAFAAPHHFMYFLSRVRQQQNVLKGSPLSTLLQDAYADFSSGGLHRYEMVSAKLTEFFIKAERTCQALPHSITEADREMLALMDYIDANITHKISLRAVANHAGMSDSAFSRRFSQWNGVTFKEYVTEKKIRHAIRLLQTTNRKMIDIALECGFESLSGFYDTFQKRTGMTPRKFSRQDERAC